MKKVRVTEGIKEKGKVAEMQEKLEMLKGMSAKQLVEYAKKEFKTDLPIGNGRPWIYKKIAYMEQERLTGNNGKAAEKAKKLDDPVEIEKMKRQAEAEIEDVKQRSKTQIKKTGVKTAKKVDEYGFREGTMASGMFAALVKGCSKTELNKIGDREVVGFLRGIKTKLGIYPNSREAVIVEKDGVLKIQSYKNK